MKKTICMFMSVVLLLLSFFLSACAQEPAATTETTEAKSSCWLDISAEVDTELDTTELAVPGSERVIYHSGLIAPKVWVDGSYIPLEEAVANGQLTPELVMYYTRMDALEENCKQTHATINGLTYFIYEYETYDVITVYDVFRTPAKGDRVIEEIRICDRWYKKSNPNLSYNSLTDENGERLYFEDWGLKFEVTEVTATGVSLHISQVGKQPYGQLRITNFLILPYEWEGDWWEKEVGPYDDTQDLTINRFGGTDLHISWESLHGALPSGRYRLDLTIAEVDANSDVHPFMINYQSSQLHSIEEIIIP